MAMGLSTVAQQGWVAAGLAVAAPLRETVDVLEVIAYPLRIGMQAGGSGYSEARFRYLTRLAVVASTMIFAPVSSSKA